MKAASCKVGMCLTRDALGHTGWVPTAANNEHGTFRDGLEAKDGSGSRSVERDAQ